jgi:DNA-binding GntR family transcriptional regulator
LSLEKLSRPESLAEMAQRELRNAIIEGRLKLGDQLSEIRLSKMLGISKTPVREALMQLKREGLVQIDPQRGTSIFRIEDREIDQIAGFRRLLETEAARLIFASEKSSTPRRMAEILEAMELAIAREAFQSYRKLDADFHMALIEGAGNPYLVSAYGLIAAKIGALRSRAHDDTQVVSRSLETHRRLLRLLEAGDEEKFNELIDFHIANTGRDYRAWLARQTAADETATDDLASEATDTASK